ncbi:hypothetical protein WISP_145564 [Willisornis vidua]|uniref:Uncharacterized protein n=1 Tax=Willisornis vidua TaxID=1566151 RepID=A0ABQ9CRI5_9PASS|nr:hypothetical protein WISP_145564 [Willisornis vidua]
MIKEFDIRHQFLKILVEWEIHQNNLCLLETKRSMVFSCKIAAEWKGLCFLGQTKLYLMGRMWALSEDQTCMMDKFVPGQQDGISSLPGMQCQSLTAGTGQRTDGGKIIPISGDDASQPLQPQGLLVFQGLEPEILLKPPGCSDQLSAEDSSTPASAVNLLCDPLQTSSLALFIGSAALLNGGKDMNLFEIRGANLQGESPMGG